MQTLFVTEPGFFEGHLTGARIPVFLAMLRAARAGGTVHALPGQARVAVAIDAAAPSMDAALATVRTTPVSGPARYARTLVQKGRALPALPDVAPGETVLMLNDARARQAMNQFHELLSGRFGADPWRMTAPLRALQGLRRDRAQMARFDCVHVQTAPEAAFLRRWARGTDTRIEIFNNAQVTLALFPDLVVPPTDRARPGRFVLPVPPGLRREGEYAWFLRRLADTPDLLAQTTVLAPAAFARHIPGGVAAQRTDVPDFQAWLAGFDCVLVPTGHYTGLNNRVFQAAVAGCDIIASPEALEGLMGAVAQAPRRLGAFRHAMRAYPEGVLRADTLLAAVARGAP